MYINTPLFIFATTNIVYIKIRGISKLIEINLFQFYETLC